jgi:hypothetical protein
LKTKAQQDLNLKKVTQHKSHHTGSTAEFVSSKVSALVPKVAVDATDSFPNFPNTTSQM